MFKILLDAINRQDFFDKGSPGDYSGSFGYSSLIAIFGVNLADPAGITIRGRSYEYPGVKIAEMEGFRIGCGREGHEFSVNEKRKSFKWKDFLFFDDMKVLIIKPKHQRPSFLEIKLSSQG